MEKRCIGVDLGGTSVKLGLLTLKGELIKKWEIPTRKEENGKQILPDIANSIRENIEKEGMTLTDLLGVGIGVPGPVSEDGFVERCVNLGWSASNPAKLLSEFLGGTLVKAGNDANVAALGEQWMGRGKGHRSLMMYTLGTGVGGGVILDGKIVSGYKGMGGEIGHVTVNMEEEDTCNCGNHGCLEQYASATGIVKEMKRTLQKGVNSCLSLTQEFTCKEVLDAAKANDAAAKETIHRCMKYLGLSMSFVSYVVDPEIFVIGGGVSKAGEYLALIIKEYYESFCVLMKAKAEIGLATLGNDAGIFGAAKMVL